MAKTRSLPDKFYDKDYEHNGIHRVPLWRIAGYALNNTATNLYLMMMNYATYYLMGWVGVGNMSYNVFVPYYPMLIDGMYKGYQVSTASAKFTTEKPDTFCTYGTSWTVDADGNRQYA